LGRGERQREREREIEGELNGYRFWGVSSSIVGLTASGILLCTITFIVNVISHSFTKGGGDCGIINIEYVQCAGGYLFQTVKTGTFQRAFQIEHSHNKLQLKREREIERQRER